MTIQPVSNPTDVLYALLEEMETLERTGFENSIRYTIANAEYDRLWKMGPRASFLRTSR